MPRSESREAYVDQAVKAAIAEIESIAKGAPVVLPEAVKPGQWTVLPVDNLAGKTNIEELVMQVPFGESVMEGGVRLHEMAHAKWTTSDQSAVLSELGDYIQVVEDMRMHYLLSETVSHWDLFGDTMTEDVRKEYKAGHYPTDEQNKILLEIAARQHNSGEVLPDLSPEGKALVDSVQRQLYADPTPDKAIELARYIRDVFEGDAGDGPGTVPEPEGDSPGDNPGEGSGTGEGESGPTAADSDEDGEGSASAESPPPSPLRGGGRPALNLPTAKVVGTPIYTNYGARWAPMEMLRPELSVGIDRSRVEKRARRREKYGTVPSNIHRAFTDGKVFTKRAKKKKPGGTILLDKSGSMGLSNEELEKLVLNVKHGTVAAYNATCSPGKEGTPHGWLTLIAENFMRVGDVSVIPSGGNNLVDGPAIRWLAAQSEPRIWISDGQVTGISSSGNTEEFDDGLSKEVGVLVERYKIKQYQTIEDYLADSDSS